MALIDKETIYSEIEARREHMVYELYGLEENTPEYQRVKGMHDAYVDLLTYLTYSLPEQPVEGLDITDFCKPVEPDIAKCVADHWWEMADKQPVEGLEEELERFIESGESVTVDDYGTYQVSYHDFKKVARHFAEWGEKNAYKAIMKKADEVRDKRFDTDYEVKIDPAAGFDLGCVNVYHEGKLVGQYVEPKEEKKLPEDLEEAAWKYAPDLPSYNIGGGYLPPQSRYDLRTAFKDGAEWQKEQMGKQAREQLAKDEITLADLVAFDEGLSLGRRLERQDMMKKAVGGRYMKAASSVYVESWPLDIDPDSVKAGDEVRLIVIPEKSEKVK